MVPVVIEFSRMRALIAWRIDAIFTDRPDLMIGLLGEWKQMPWTMQCEPASWRNLNSVPGFIRVGWF